MTTYQIIENQLPKSIPGISSGGSSNSASMVFRRDASAIPSINGSMVLPFPAPVGNNFSLNPLSFLVPAISTAAPLIKTKSTGFIWSNTTLIVPETASYLYTLACDINTVSSVLSGTLLIALVNDFKVPYTTIDNVGYVFGTVTPTTPNPTILNCIVKHNALDRVNIALYAAPVPTISAIPNYNIKITSLQFSCVQI